MTFVLRRILLTITLILLPVSAFAKQETVWSFLMGNVPGRWEVKGGIASPTPTPDGLHITTDRKGYMIRTTELEHPIEQIEMTYVSLTPFTVRMLFRPQSSASFDAPLLELPLALKETAEPRTVSLDVLRYDNWDPATMEIGIAFDPGTNFLLQDLRFASFNPLEKLWGSMRSFWAFDDFRPYSVNFLWGPHLVGTPAQRAHLFEAPPPQAIPANWTLYGIALVAMATAASLWGSKHISGRNAALIPLATIAALWVLYDIRMGSEFISYALDDVRLYWSKPIGERIFREWGPFQSFAAFVSPYVEGEEEYVFIPFFEQHIDVLRYNTYPALPVRPEDADGTERIWVVCAREDVQLGSGGQLMLNGEPISPPGSIVARFDPESFVFETTQ